MSVTPQTLSKSGGTWPSNHEYRWVSSGTDYELYNLFVDNQEQANHEIGVYTNSSSSNFNVWFDFGTDNPTLVTESNGNVVLGNSVNPSTYVFVKPTTASWISSGGSGGGGTTTEGTGDPVPVGSKYFNNLDQLVFVVGSSSPTSDADIVYKIFRGPDRYNMTQVFVLSHMNGSDTEYNVGDPSSFKRWELRLESNDVQYDSQILVDYSAGKVSCNFW